MSTEPLNPKDFDGAEPPPLSTGMPKMKLSASRFVITVLAHVGLLLIAGVWVISSHLIKPKENLVFSSERPSASANKKPGQHQVKMAKKNSGGAPPNAKRITSSAGASGLAIPNVTTSSLSDFQPGRMGGGMGGGLGGFGLGSGSGLGGGGGMGLGGGGGRIKFFGFESDASSVILAIDVSGSMETNVGGPAGIAKLRAEIKRTIESLSAASLFNIICFAGEADSCFPTNVRATADNKAIAIEFMAGYYGDGGFGRTRTEKLRSMGRPVNVDQTEYNGIKFTPLLVENIKGMEGTSGGSRMDLALVAAMERQATAVFLLSDGQPTPVREGEALKRDEIIDLVRDSYKRLYSGNKEMVVNTIYTNTDRRDEDFMKTIARRFKGRHKDVKLE